MKRLIFILLLLITTYLKAQTFNTINGSLKQHANQSITLKGFNYYKSYELATTTTDSLGNFKITYPTTYKGMGVLKTQDNNSLVIVLTEPLLQIKGTHINEVDSLQLNSSASKHYVSYAKAHIQAKQAYRAWRYLQPLYASQPTLQTQKKVIKTINKELQRLEQVSANTIKKIPENNYLHWFLPIQTLVSNMPESIHNYTERLPKHIQQFRSTNFNNPNFKTSGLFKELIEGHYFLLENMGKSLDSVYIEMNTSTDYLIKSLKGNDVLLNTVSEALFKYFEKRSLISVAAHLSTQMLSQNKSVLSTELANKMQKYSVLKVGNIAPDIQLDATTTLSSIKKPVLLVFGTSTCPSCKDDAIEMLNYYETWKEKVQLEVIYISLDTDQKAFEAAYKNAPWKTYCDYKGWETQAAKDYYINATPTYIMLDKDLKILAHPHSLKHADTWVNYRM